jgi:hypothetical protein
VNDNCYRWTRRRASLCRSSRCTRRGSAA